MRYARAPPKAPPLPKQNKNKQRTPTGRVDARLAARPQSLAGVLDGLHLTDHGRIRMTSSTVDDVNPALP